MSKIWQLLNEPDTVVLFDVDGTLTSYSYGELHSHHELDFTTEFRNVNIYADCKCLLPMYNYIKRHGVDRVFCISKEPHGHEDWKSQMLERLYGIPEDHCYYTTDTAEKTALAERIVREHFGEFPPGKVICVDDNDETLALYMKQTDFCTAHPMIFMENVQELLELGGND